MVNLKGKFWLIGLISALLGLLSIGIPWQIPYHPTIPNYYGFYWLFGVQITIPAGDPIVQYIFFTIAGMVGLVSFIIIAVFSLLLLIVSLKARKGLSVKIGVLWLIGGLLLIFIDMFFFIFLGPYAIFYVIQLGSILPFIAGGLALATGIATIVLSKRG